MIKEHLVSASVTNGAECICNPEILFGTKYGLWDFENELAPRGALMDLNAAWELFLSRTGFFDVSFDRAFCVLNPLADLRRSETAGVKIDNLHPFRVRVFKLLENINLCHFDYRLSSS